MRRTDPHAAKKAPKARSKSPPPGAGAKGVKRAMAEAEAVEQNKAITDILRVIGSSPGDLQPVFDTILAHAIRLCEGDAAVLWQYEGNALHFAASRRAEANKPGTEAVSDYFRKNPLPLGTYNPTPQAALEKRAVHVADVFANRKYRPLVPKDSFGTAPNSGTVLAVPLLRQDELFGVISIWRFEKRLFTDKQIAMIETFAAQAAIAIHNVRLHNETRQALEQQTATADILRVISSSPTDIQPVLDAVAESAARLCEATDAVIALRRADTFGFAAHYGTIPITGTRALTRETVAGRSILEGRQFHIGDLQAETKEFRQGSAFAKQFGYRTMLATPLMREGSAIGAILVRRTEARLFSEAHLALVRTFADQAVIAIQNVRLFNETNEALERQTATSEILGAISGAQTDAQPVFETIAHNAVRLCGAIFCNVLRYDGERLHIAAYHGFKPEFLATLHSMYPMRPAESQLSGRVVLEKAVVRIADAQTDERYDSAYAVAGGWRRMLAVPMMREGMPLGVIVVAWQDAGDTQDSQVNLLKTFADQAVIAIENVRLFNETKEALEQQTATSEILRVIAGSPTDVQPVFDTIVRNAATLCNGMFANAFRYDGERLHFAATSVTNPEARKLLAEVYPRQPDKTQMSGRAILAKAVVRMEDALSDPDYDRRHAQVGGWRRMLGVPMLREGNPIGAIVVAWAEPGPISKMQELLLQTFADQAVIAIENVRLFNETRESLEQQTAISEVLRVISSSPADVRPVLEAVAERAAKICEAVDAQIFLREGDDMRHVARFGPIPIGIDLGKARRLSRGWAAGRAVLEARAIHLEDLLAVPREEYPVSHELRDRAGHRTLLSVPLMRERRALGAISLRRMEVRPFSGKQIALLQTFADQAAIAIENVRLFNETKEALEQQKASAEVLGAISSSIADTKPVFDRIVQSCKRLFGSSIVGITIVGEDEKLHLQAYDGPGREEFDKALFPLPIDRNSGNGCAIVERRVFDIPDSEADGVPEGARRGHRATRSRASLFAPMMWQGEGIGTIFFSRELAGSFSEKEINLLKTFADQAVIAIQNARLFREIQEKSAQLEIANKHKSDFLANMSHELRTPLNAIIGFSEALMERMFGELNEKQADYLKDIHESGRHLLSLINDILDLSKIEAGRMDLELSSFHLPTALSNAMTLIRERAQRHGIELGLEVDQRLGEFAADERKFKQIMLNLLSNAVKFTPDGGRVDVCAKKDTDKIEIAVKDTGIGIAPEDQAAVFEEFKQVGRDQMRKAEGTGLGLALTRRFVELHGGAIRLESTPGKGSTFTVSLPLRQ